MFIKYKLITSILRLVQCKYCNFIVELRAYLPKVLKQHLKLKIINNYFYYFIIWLEWHFFFNNNNKLEALLSPSFFKGLMKCVFKTRSIKGNIIELGTYKGGSTIMCARFLKKLGIQKKIYACDTFEGHPYDDKFSSQNKCKGCFSDTNDKYVKDKFRKYGVEKDILIIKGKFEDILPAKLRLKRFSLAFIDCDLYDSSKFALKFLYPRMENKSIICFHDYNPHSYRNSIWGITKAINEFSHERKMEVRLTPIPHFLIIKK